MCHNGLRFLPERPLFITHEQAATKLEWFPSALSPHPSWNLKAALLLIMLIAVDGRYSLKLQEAGVMAGHAQLEEFGAAMRTLSELGVVAKVNDGLELTNSDEFFVLTDLEPF